MDADTRLSLLHEILLAPNDDLPRLVYCDALEETGDEADMALAIIIRDQLSDPDTCFLPRIQGPGVTMTMRRGFVEQVTLDSATFGGWKCPRCSRPPMWPQDECGICGDTGGYHGIAAWLFANHPVTRVTLTDASRYDVTGRHWDYRNRTIRVTWRLGWLGQSVFHESWWVNRMANRNTEAEMYNHALVTWGRSLVGLPELP